MDTEKICTCLLRETGFSFSEKGVTNMKTENEHESYGVGLDWRYWYAVMFSIYRDRHRKNIDEILCMCVYIHACIS